MSYADPETSESEDNFEDGLDFQDQDESISGIRRRLSDEAAVARVGEALNRTLEADRQAAPRDHFSPVQVRFPVNAPSLRPPVDEATTETPEIMEEFEVENGQDGAKASELGRQIKVEFSKNDIVIRDRARDAGLAVQHAPSILWILDLDGAETV